MFDYATTLAPLPFAEVLDAINGLVAVVIFNRGSENSV